MSKPDFSACAALTAVDALSGIEKQGERFVADSTRSWLALLSVKPKGIVASDESWGEFRRSECFRFHPLASVPERALTEFEKSIVFRNLGLAHANYRSLTDYLSEEQFDDVLTIFGIGRRLAEDYKNKECAKRATCSTSYADICTSNCFWAPDDDFFGQLFDRSVLDLIGRALKA